MQRSFLVALAAAGALLITAGAQAKAPPDGVQICGATGVCASLAWQDAETLPALWSDQYEPSAPAPASPFYLIRWHWPNSPENTAYYVPRDGKILHVWQSGIVRWSDLPATTDTLRSKSAALEPFPVPKILSVTVGGRQAKDPQSYLRLFGRGHQDWPILQPKWIAVKIIGDAPSPWTGAAADVWVSRRGSYLSIDGAIVKIPLQLARRIRRGASLLG
jgi:hypothetical protein